MLNWFSKKPSEPKEQPKEEVWIDEEVRDKIKDFSEKLGMRTHVAVRSYNDEVYDYMELRLKGNNWIIAYRVIGSSSEWQSGAYYVSEFQLIPRAEYDALQDVFHEIHETILALGGVTIGSTKWTIPQVTNKMALVSNDSNRKTTEHLLTICNMYSDLSLNEFVEDLRIRSRLIKSTVTDKVVSPGSQLLILNDIDKVKRKPSSKSVTVLSVCSLEQMLDKVPMTGEGVYLLDLIVQDNETMVVRHMDRARLIHPDTYKMLTTTLDGTEIFK